ncbi:MAG: peptide ABC transporter substrate-binding protein [Chloroflexaceae bacterium]|nr:peptide ABC transporter substrate-binding protein [Chloroflexaceae bacterium]
MIALIVLAGCEIEGGVTAPTPMGRLPTITPFQTAAPAASAPPEVAPEQTAEPGAASAMEEVVTDTTAVTPTASVLVTQTGNLRIGMVGEPSDLLPYHTNPVDERMTAPISELLFPSPLLAVTYDYTSTGVLERIPTLDNGDITVQTVEVYLDELGAISVEPTDVLTTAQQLAITYRWNPDLYWADGVPVSASDSVFAYELAQRVSLGEDATKRLLLLDDYQQVDEHITRALLRPELIDFTASQTITLDLRGSDFGQTFWTPLPRHLLQDVAPTELLRSPFALQPVGYGPYTVERRTTDTIRLQRNPYYQGDAPAADGVTFVFAAGITELREAVLQGSLDVAALETFPTDVLPILDQDAAAGTLQVHYVPNPIWEHLDFNLDFTLLQDARLRRAIAHGFDRQALVDTLFMGKVPVLDSWILPQHWAAAPTSTLTIYPYQPDVARSLLDEVGLIDYSGDGFRDVGFDHDSNGEVDASVPITLTLITTDNSPLRAAIFAQFQQDMAAIGLGVTSILTPSQELFNPNGLLFRRGFELAQFAWIASPDPRGFELWSCSGIPSEANNWSGSNLPGWCTREANQTIITATTALDYDTRHAAYLRHQQLFTQELPTLPLFQRLTLVINSPRLVGLRPDPTAPITWNMTEWSRQ